MVDVYTPEKRSEVMSAIRGRGNKSTELMLVSAMRKAGITGWRRHIVFKLDLQRIGNKSPTGRRRPSVICPDFTFRKERLVVFVDGCFWHRCPLHQTVPKNNAEFWAAKLDSNVIRDKAVNAALRRKGWGVMRIWEHQLKNAEQTIRKLRRRLSLRSNQLHESKAQTMAE